MAAAEAKGSKLHRTPNAKTTYPNGEGGLGPCWIIDCIDYVTGIGNAHAHNGVHSVLRLG